MNTNIQTKKAAVDLTDLALGVVILGLMVTIGATILVNLRDNRLTDLSTVTTSNETITGNNVTGDTLSNTWFKSLTSIVNASNASQAVPSSNYTLSTSAIDGTATITINGATWNGSSINVTYDSYNTSRADWQLANDSAVGIAEYGNWFKIIVIVGVAAVVLSLIFMAFGRNSSSVGQSY